jgi:hypothetical protein
VALCRESLSSRHSLDLSFHLFSVTDGSPVGEKSPETKVRLSQEQKIVDIPGEHKPTETQNIQEQEWTDTQREVGDGRMSLHLYLEPNGEVAETYSTPQP